ncbi:MAG: WYL domain-containing protein [Lentisphaerae bacterium]|nr:MAG: WYL domain-containing protein [Lentisphaerota bacterium]
MLKRLRRLIVFVGLLKLDQRINIPQFLIYLRQYHPNLSTTVRTFKRDLNYLKQVLKAPIRYQHSIRSYVLEDKSWVFPFFEFSTVLGEELFTAAASYRVAQPLFPPHWSAMVERTLESVCLIADPDDLSSAQLESLVFATGATPALNSAIFRRVEACWRECRTCRIKYQGIEDHTPIWREVDPHVLFLYENAWYIHGFCHLRGEPRTFAIHRILAAEPLDKKFSRSPEFIEHVIGGRFFNYPQVKHVRLICSAEKSPVIREREWFPHQTMTPLPDGRLQLDYSEVMEPQLIYFVLSYGGHLEVVQPESLRKKVLAIAQALVATHA